MDYREKAVRCVRETVLPVQAAQFRACGCDLDAQYRKYGDTESFFAKVLQPGRLYEVGYPKCVCPEVLRGETADAAHCECSRQSVLYILEQLHGNTLNPQILHDALWATAHKRGTERHLAEAAEVFEEVENSSVMQKLWESYRRKFSYAADLEWSIIMGAVRSLYALCEKGSSL